MGLFGLPAEVLIGTATGGSAAFFTTFELSSDSEIAKFCFQNRIRRVATCVTAATIIGWGAGPVAGLVAEMIMYPAACYKTRDIQKRMQKASKNVEPGKSTYICYDGKMVAFTKKKTEWKQFQLCNI